MEFTGERFHPDLLREIWYEHYHRYAFARELVHDRDVLDLACGEGYGSDLLARAAKTVVGVDRSSEAISHAMRRYQRPNLRFVEGDATAIPFENDRFDTIVSFETIEHLAPQVEMLDEFVRVLKPSGCLVISSPDRRTYSDERDYDNEFHVRELYEGEFRRLLDERFGAVRMLGQRLAFVSMIWSEGDAGRRQLSALDRDGTRPVGWPLEPLYWVAVCAHDESALPDVPGTSLFTDPAQSVYAHYYHEIRKNMAAGAIVAERDVRIAELEAQVAQLEAESASPESKDRNG